jgi:hypothetical protein
MMNIQKFRASRMAAYFRLTCISALIAAGASSAFALDAASNSATNAPAKAENKDAEKAAAPKSGRDALMFRNGDVLFGSLNGIDPTNGISWARTDALSDFRFLPEMLTELDFAPAEPHPPQVSSNLCNVQLGNGDELQGALVSYDGQKLKLDTWFAGTLEIPKSSVALIVPLGLPKPTLFQGPDGLEGWTMGEVNAAAGGALADSGVWMYQNHAFYAGKSASVARDIHLPDSSSLSFDMDWRGFLQTAVAIYTAYLQPVNLVNKDTEPKYGGFYSVQLNNFSANLLPVKQGEPLRYLGQGSLQSLSQKTSAHFDIRASKSKHMVALLVDGVLVKQWVDDSGEFAGTGTAVRFVHQGQGAVKLSNIKVTEWDGTFEEPISVTPNKTQDLARLKNGDRVPGTIKSVGGGKMTIVAAGKDLEIPISRVKQIELASLATGSLALKPTTVRAFFASGGSLTFDLQKWSAGELAAASENFGQATFKPGTFSRIVFDLSPASAAR